MYLSHYGLQEPPFSITPDVEFAYLAQPYQAALNTLLIALAGGEGFVKITGEVGTGKTLLCRTLLARMSEEAVTAYIPNPLLSPREMLRKIGLDLGLRVKSIRQEGELFARLEAELIKLAGQGKRVVLCIDEAQALPVQTLESLRLLSNLETSKRKLIQIVLFGQPEFDAMLGDASLRSLASRIAFGARLHGLSFADFESYLRHRLSVAGWRGGEVFSWGARWLLWRGSRGVPRRANALANKCLLLAYGEGSRYVTAHHAWQALRDEHGLLEAMLPVIAMGAKA